MLSEVAAKGEIANLTEMQEQEIIESLKAANLNTVAKLVGQLKR